MTVFGMVRPDANTPVEFPEQEREIGVQRAAGIFHYGQGQIEDEVRVEADQLGVTQELHIAAVEQNHPRPRRGLQGPHEREEGVGYRSMLQC